MKKKRNIVMTFVESIYGALTPDRTEEITKTQAVYRSFRARAQAQRRSIEIIADNITAFFGNISFAILHIIWFIVWILINLELVPGLEPFDPYPFGLLTMIVSLEAIFLSVFVLLSQNREAQISDLREEIDFQINQHAEQEITQLIKMTNEIHQHLGLSKQPNPAVKKMMQALDTEQIEAEIKKEEGVKEG